MIDSIDSIIVVAQPPQNTSTLIHTRLKILLTKKQGRRLKFDRINFRPLQLPTYF